MEPTRPLPATLRATSSDGTQLAVDVVGGGPAVVLVGGMFCHRPAAADLAAALAPSCTAVSYDRRGRGDSGGAGVLAGPDALERELEDLAAVLDRIEELAGPVTVYGHSSGAGLVLHAAAAGLPVQRLVLHEPPWGGDDPDDRASARALAAEVGEALAERRPGDAIARFLGDAGLPPEVIGAMASDPAMLAVAPTMGFDLAIMGDAEGGSIPVDAVRSVTVPTLVVAGGASPAFFRTTAERLVQLLPQAELVVLEGHDHGAPADAVAPVVAGFVHRTA
jgi:pimeloyl-ACP methyl ester carboxylesterase